MSDPKQALQRLDSEVAQRQEPSATMLSIIARAAADPSVDVNKMERLMAMQERLVARDAELAFNSAMRDVQAKVKYVQKDAKNPSTNSHYTRLETLNRAIVPVATDAGFSLSFGTADCPVADSLRITCTVLHSAGHSRQYQCDVPLDVAGAKGNPNKTRTHGYGSSLSYGRRYLTLLIFNVSTGEDDDGNAAGGGAEGPEVIVGLKALVWRLLAKHGRVQNGQTWREARQFLTDEMLLDPELSPDDLDAAGWRKLLAASTKKLEG